MNPADVPAHAGGGRIRDLTRLIWREDRGGAVRTGGLILVGALLEGFGVLLLVPLLQLVGIGGAGDPGGEVTRVAERLLGAVGWPLSLPGVLLLFLLVLTLQAGVHRAQSLAVQRLTASFALRLREALYTAITGARWDFIARKRSASFTHLLTDETDRAAQGAIELVYVVTGAAVGAAYLAVAVRISPMMSLVAFGCGLGMWAALRTRVQRSRRRGAELGLATSTLYRAITEHLGALKTTRSYGAQARQVAAFSATAGSVTAANMASAASYADVRFLFSVGGGLVLAVLVYVGAGVMALPGASILLLLYVFSRLLPRVSTMQQLYQQLIHSLPALGSVRAAISECQAAVDAAGPTLPAPRMDGVVRMERVTYLHDQERGVRDATLEIRAGEVVALTGPSGAGKSTLADLLMGLLAPQDGTLSVDGTPLIPQMLASWRKQVGYVSQETYLLDASLAENLLLGRADAAEGELWESLRLASLDDFVRALPDGLATEVGERGVMLSGGERQRVALARALVRRPSLLILDEATSALDAENEQRILASVRGLHGTTAVLVISHRPALLAGADRAYAMVGGRLALAGSGGDARGSGAVAPLAFVQDAP